MRRVFILVHVVFVLKLFYTAAAMCEFLLTCEERMALRANVKSHLRLCGLCHECVAASTCYFAVYIFRMNSFFHFGSSFVFYLYGMLCVCGA